MSFPKTEAKDELVWMTTRPTRAALVAANILHRSFHWNLKRPACVVFDIDETLLLNNPLNNDTIKVQQVGKTLFDTAAEQDVPIFLVTARAKCTWTLKYIKEQLRSLGYDLSKIKGVYMQPKSFIENRDGGAVFKKQARKMIGENYTIVLNLGDKWGDVLTNFENEGIQKKVTQTKNTYIGIKPAESFTLYSMKFPDEV